MANERLIEVISPQSYEAIQKLVSSLSEALDLTVKWNKELKELRGTKPSEMQKAFREATQNLMQARKAVSDYERQERQLENTQKRRMQSANDLNRQMQKRRIEIREINRQMREEGILTSRITTEYQKLEVRYNQVGRRIQSLVAQKQLNGKLSKEAEAELRRLEKQYGRYHEAITKADHSIKRFNRNVGNYRSALSGLAGSVTSLVQAFGLVGGVYIFARALRDTFSRIKDFDNSMQNLAGVMRTTRGELQGLEKDIVAVAGRSVRTSNEVAKLAETLATLGQSKESISELLEPVINLSLGLDASADEAGEFLIQMLNTFGKSTDSAAEFADTIATIRTSTTLDFRKMRDSFAYIAPISALLNQDLAHTGALVGILADNGIKAESAGRLLSTSLIKLASEGISLNEALEDINNAIESGATEMEVLTVASQHFGTQGSKIGVVLAKNSELIDKNTDAIRGNAGALDDLIEQQLESMENQIRILDSAWEQFILTLDSGEGIISRFVRSQIWAATGVLNWLTKINTAASEYVEKGLAQGFEDTTDRLRKLNQTLMETGRTEEEARAAIISQANVMANQANLHLQRLDEQIKKEGRLTKEMQQRLAYYEAMIDAANMVLQGDIEIQEVISGKRIVAEQRRTIADIRKEIRDLQGALEDIDVTDKARIKTTRDKIKALQDELNALLGLSRAERQQVEVVRNSIVYFRQQIRDLEELRDKTARTREEFERFNNEILKLQNSVSKLNGEWERYLRSMQEGATPMGIDLKEYKAATDELEAHAEKIDKIAAANERRRKQELYTSRAVKEAFVSLGETLGVSSQVVDDFFENLQDGFKDLESSVDSFRDIFNSATRIMAQNQNRHLEERLEKLRKQRDIEIEFAGDSAEARGAIEERFQRKEAAIKNRMARNEKRAAVVTSIINTATAVTKTLATLGWPAGIAPAAIIAGLGAAQTAIIAGQNIPQFKDGVRGFEGGLAILGDGGKHEPVTDRSGKLLGVSPDRPTLVNLPKGSNVYKDYEDFERDLNHTLKLNGISPLGAAVNSPVVVIRDRDNNGLTEEQMRRVMRESLSRMPKNVVTIDENGINKYAKKQYSKGINLNNRVTFKGMDV